MTKGKFLFLVSIGAACFFTANHFFKKKDVKAPAPIQEIVMEATVEEPVPQVVQAPIPIAVTPPSAELDDGFPGDIDIVDRLFSTGKDKLSSIVDTITFTSKVPWLPGKLAWISDYAVHYSTSKHFIARSLNKKRDYFSQKVSFGSKFNVFKRDKNIQFNLVVNLKKCKMALYYFDADAGERTLLKTYNCELGAVNEESVSGYLTPVGTYLLGDKVAVYKPGIKGYFGNKKIDLITVFGTRWIPLAQEVDERCSAPANGFGIHGVSWVLDEKTQELVEDTSTIGTYHSNGCIKLVSSDMEELFAIIITKPTFVEIVKDFREARLPGKEVYL